LETHFRGAKGDYLNRRIGSCGSRREAFIVPEWLTALLPEGWSTTELVLLSVGLIITTSVISLILVIAVVIRMPPDYFTDEYQKNPRYRNRWLHILFAVFRNLLGVFLVALGIVLSLPGVPGQGLLTILIGVMLLDFPGKIRFERWLATRRGVLSRINKLRARYGRPPMLVPSDRQNPVA